MFATDVFFKSLGRTASMCPLLKNSFARMSFLAAVATAIFASDRAAIGIPITLQNPGFENTTGVTFNNANDPTVENAHALSASSYNGWAESAPNFSAGSNGNTGPINVSNGDIPIETPFGDLVINTAGVSDAGDNGDEDESPDVNFPKIALYAVGDVRVNQTTGYAITGLETSFTMTIDVARSNAATFRGYNFSIYRDNAGTRTILGTLSSSVNGGDPAIDAWVTKTLTITGDFSAFAGQFIGASIYQDGAATGGTGGSSELWYDNVTLSYIAIPEPSSLLILTSGSIGLFLVRRKRTGVAFVST